MSISRGVLTGVHAKCMTFKTLWCRNDWDRSTQNLQKNVSPYMILCFLLTKALCYVNFFWRLTWIGRFEPKSIGFLFGTTPSFMSTGWAVWTQIEGHFGLAHRIHIKFQVSLTWNVLHPPIFLKLYKDCYQGTFEYVIVTFLFNTKESYENKLRPCVFFYSEYLLSFDCLLSSCIMQSFLSGGLYFIHIW